MIIKITPDKERAKSMLNMIKDTEEFLLTADMKKFSTLVAKGYYDIIRELVSIVLLLDGFKTMGDEAHKETINFLLKYKEFSEEDIFLLNDLRIRRNKSSYEGKAIPYEYISTRKNKFLDIIFRLKRLVAKKFI